MGRKSKLKKIRKQLQAESRSDSHYEPTQFVEQFNRMGYQVIQRQNSGEKSLGQTKSSANPTKLSPEIPTEEIFPEL